MADREEAPDVKTKHLSNDDVRVVQMYLKRLYGAALGTSGIIDDATIALAARALAEGGPSAEASLMGKLAAIGQMPIGQAATRPPIASGLWLFYGRGPSLTWVDELVADSTLFWKHGTLARGGNYKRQLKTDDTIVVMAGNFIVATGVLLADDALTFVDRQGNIRRPVRIHARLTSPIERQAVETAVGAKLIPNPGGGVFPVTAPALAAINEALAERGLELLPFSRNRGRRMRTARSLVADIEQQGGWVLPTHETAQLLGWGGPVFAGSDQMPPDAAADAAPNEDDDPREAGDAPAEAGDLDEASVADLDSHIPFVLDAPAETEDELERGPFALFLAQRLHLIWCQMNGHAPGPDGLRLRRQPADADTFIVHVDAPWGGGKTTFANFIARVLDPRGERLSERHFLRSSLAPTKTGDALAAHDLTEIFVPRYARDVPYEWPGARRPWIVARYNAWRDQYVLPPWWQLFLTVETAIQRALRQEACAERKAAWVDPSRWEGVLSAIGRGIAIWAHRTSYQLWNSRLKTQVLLLMAAASFLLLFWKTGVVELARDALSDKDGRLDPKEMGAWLALAVAALAFCGASVAGLFTAFGQSLAPDLDFSAEHKQIGVRDPIARFRRMFHRILDHAERPVLLIVDDLDRCEPKTVVEILRGFQTVIRSPRLFVLLLGDRAWIETAHDVHHKDLSSMRAAEGTLGSLFVQKVIQLSFRLPTMKDEARASYAQGVLGGSPTAGRGAELDELYQRVESEVAPVLAAGESVGRTEAALAVIKEQRKAELSDSLDADTRAAVEARIDEIVNVALVAAAGGDAAQQRAVFNAVNELVAGLPNNPRQIKRIFMAFATYEAVGRAYFGYQLTPSGPDGERLARRWWQLAVWVTLATEWPETWRAVARRPEIIDSAYAASADQPAADAAVLALVPEAEQPGVRELWRRLRSDPSLGALLSGSPAAPDDAPLARAGLESAAIYEFNRIIWEPGFPLAPPVVAVPAPKLGRRRRAVAA